MSDPCLPANLPNPYDFANPVYRKELFAGRANELKEIRYYLDHAARADRSINLALLGARASGKTSLLNIIEIDAAERNFLSARVDLNESDAESAMAFWYKLVDSIISRVVEEAGPSGDKFFGGPTGKVYDTYLDMITTYAVPDDKEFCPFVFPMQYAKAMSVGNRSPQVSDQILRRDLQLLASEVKRPIVILIDEGNVLSTQRVLLEMLRNTFMNLSGYMLVLTGTPELFPVMDEVFSPIVRQFKRIDVAAFADIRDTVAVAREPLKLLGMEEMFPAVAKDIDSLPPGWPPQREIDELHELTGGRPYEIKLVCHFMFRRVQEGKDEIMQLSLEVLEDVLRELRRNQDVDARPIISAVRHLEVGDLEKLSLLLPSAGKVPLDELLFALRITRDLKTSAHELRDAADQFVSEGILTRSNSALRFRGDDFDRIVCTYAARQRGVHLVFEEIPLDRYFGRVVLRADGPEVRFAESLGKIGRGGIQLAAGLKGQGSIFERLDKRWGDLQAGSSMTELMQRWPEQMGRLYRVRLWSDQGRDDAATLLRVAVEGAGVEYRGVFCWASNAQFELAREELGERLGWMAQAAAKMDGRVVSETKEIRGAAVDEMLDVILDKGDESVMAECAMAHATRMLDSYLAQNREAAYADAARAARLVSDRNLAGANNVAYILIQAGRLDEAERLLGMVVKSKPAAALPVYNLAMLQLQRGAFELARGLLKDVIGCEAANPTHGYTVLMVPELVDGKITLRERWKRSKSAEENDPQLIDAARDALASIDDVPPH